MTYETNKESELERQQSDVIDDPSILGVESSEKTRVSGDIVRDHCVDGSNEGFLYGGVDLREEERKVMGSEEIRVSSEVVLGESEIEAENGFSDELQSSGGKDSSVGIEELGKNGSEEARVSLEDDLKEIDSEMQVRVSEVEAVEVGRKDGFVVGDTEVEQLMTRTEEGVRVSSGETKEDEEVRLSEVKALEVGRKDDFSVGDTAMEQLMTRTEDGVMVSSGETKEDSKFRVSEVKVSEIGRNDGLAVGDTKMGQLMTRTEEGARVSSENPKEDAEVKVSDVKSMEVGRNNGISVGDSAMEQFKSTTDVGSGSRASSGKIKGDAEVTEEPSVLSFDSPHSMVDGGSSTALFEGFGSEAEKALTYGFEPGDMVWGKVKSHPWWPGHIFHEAFASPSVRRTKREGHMLVAFFGDSSYGWFDLAELIPFEPNYAEKSRQTNSRNFMKAVEEAVDEARRRAALGLACRCRNPFNFRSMNVPGYFSVDVGGYEPGEVYSVKQIKKARDCFQPTEALSFVQQLALTPMSNEQRSLDWIKNVSMILAYRKATFEEFDETYAQAFGMQPVRPSRNSMGVVDQPARVPPRAPLSGPLVIAEALGEKKNSAKPTKVKDQSKKDKYVLKRRDEPFEPRSHHVGPGFVSSATYKEGSAATIPGDYVLQKRTPAVSMKSQVPVKQDGMGTISGRTAALTQGGTVPRAESLDKKLVVAKFNLVDTQVNMSPVDSLARYPGDKESALHEMNGSMNAGSAVGPISTGLNGSSLSRKSETPGVQDRQESKAMVESKWEVSAKLSSTYEGLEQPKPRLSTPIEDHSGSDQVWDGGGSRNVSESMGTNLVPADAKLAGRVVGTGGDGVVKKVKVLKRPGADLNRDKSITGEKKKKKKEKTCLETYPEQLQKHLKTAKDGESRKSASKSIGIGLVSREITQVDTQRKDSGAGGTKLPSEPSVSHSKVDLENIEVDLPQVLDDLLALALDPFHGLERNSPSIVRQVFLNFRSLVYQKSLVLAPPSEAETTEFSTEKSPIGSSDIPYGEDVRDLPSKRPKHLTRPEDPTKSGRKRGPSDRQEEKTAKKLKRQSDLKLMTAEKKAGKIPEMQREHKEIGSTIPAKTIKTVSVKKPGLAPARVVEPIFLVMKFPPRTTLPSIPELKARFGRFGPLDHSATRVFWKSSSCRVLFKHKSDAQLAYDALRNKAIYAQMQVNFHLKDVGAPAPEVPESSNRVDDASDEVVPQFRPGGGNDSVGEPRPMAPIQRPQHSSGQLKSILKKPSGDEAGPSMGVTRESPRVKFMLGSDESIRGEQSMMVSGSSNSSKDNNNNGISADGGSSSSSIGMGVNSKNFQKVNPPQQLPPLLPLPPRVPDLHESRGVGHFTKAPIAHYSEVVVEPRNYNNYYNTANTNTNTNTNINTNTNGIDISHQMLNLLMRCNDIVSDVKCTLGYIPYHPL